MGRSGNNPSPRSLGERFELSPWPTSGPLRVIAGLDTADVVARQAPYAGSRWTLYVELTDYPKETTVQKEPEGRPVWVDVHAGDAALRGPLQRLLVPALGLAMPVQGAQVKADLIIAPNPGNSGGIAGIIQLKRGAPKQFTSTQTRLLPAIGNQPTIFFPPFATSCTMWFRAGSNTSIIWLPREGTQQLIQPATNNTAIRTKIPIPSSCDHMTFINTSGADNYVSIEFTGLS